MGEVPAKVTEMRKELEEGRLRAVPGAFDTLEERFEEFRSILWQMATFFQGALEYPNQIDLINQVARLAQQALMKEAFYADGLVAYATRKGFLTDPTPVTTLRRQIQDLAVGVYAELARALSSASKLAFAYWEWAIRNAEADVVKTNPQQKLHVEATIKATQCLVDYSAAYSDAVDTLLVVLEAVQGSQSKT